ncbi:DUF697 domain-containing protein [Leptolyngbya sp. FACHB-36]|uniref:YcjF family protein n=1 Tax=Leptolyngbya sp. FACHB-36 TaxID=2692808 RepID=UPI0016805AB8|nr:DUF697 domain-containing protein [Leptolyngbya sp. FACHB-36]MBD2022698.1 DUF697 domain-containing protein [Leptolyngbya sp. FACHB-36]
MTANLQRPLLVGGAVLALGILGLDILEHALGDWSVYALLAGALGAGSWWLRRSSDSSHTALNPTSVVNPAIVNHTLAEAEQVLTQVSTEAEQPAVIQPHVDRFRSQVAQVQQDMHRERLRLAVWGTKGSGKTTLVQQMQKVWTAADTPVAVSELPSFSGTSETGLTADAAALQRAIATDLVLFLITGDLTNSELQQVRQLAPHKRTVLVLNKQDQYLPDEQQAILAQVQAQTRGVLPAEDVVAIAAAPTAIKVRQHQPDGEVREWLEQQPPTLSGLTDRLHQILQQERQHLVLASSLHTAVALKTQAKQALNQVRQTRAMPVVEQFQWVAAATAFASPFPTLDVLATAAINAQMILDLGAIYRQKFSLQQAQKMAVTLGGLMLKLGLVELSTQAIVSLLKTNAVTYVAGGCVQGISAAYLTRLAGLSLIEYFHTQDPNLTLTEASPLVIERLTQVLQLVFQRNQQQGLLQAFVGQAIDHFFSKPAATPLSPVPVPHSSTPPIPDNSDQNRSDVRLAIPTLDSTTLPS